METSWAQTAWNTRAEGLLGSVRQKDNNGCGCFELESGAPSCLWGNLSLYLVFPSISRIQSKSQNIETKTKIGQYFKKKEKEKAQELNELIEGEGDKKGTGGEYISGYTVLLSEQEGRQDYDVNWEGRQKRRE